MSPRSRSHCRLLYSPLLQCIQYWDHFHVIFGVGSALVFNDVIDDKVIKLCISCTACFSYLMGKLMGYIKKNCIMLRSFFSRCMYIQIHCDVVLETVIYMHQEYKENIFS